MDTEIQPRTTRTFDIKNLLFVWFVLVRSKKLTVKNCYSDIN